MENKNKIDTPLFRNIKSTLNHENESKPSVNRIEKEKDF